MSRELWRSALIALGFVSWVAAAVWLAVVGIVYGAEVPAWLCSVCVVLAACWGWAVAPRLQPPRTPWPPSLSLPRGTGAMSGARRTG